MQSGIFFGTFIVDIIMHNKDITDNIMISLNLCPYILRIKLYHKDTQMLAFYSYLSPNVQNAFVKSLHQTTVMNFL